MMHYKEIGKIASQLRETDTQTPEETIRRDIGKDIEKNGDESIFVYGGAGMYGLDTPTKKELIASQYTEQEVCDYIGATSLKHISMEGVYKAVGDDQNSCDACFTGDYPVIKEDNNNEKMAPRVRHTTRKDTARTERVLI